MSSNIKISEKQLMFLIVGFLFGSTVIINPATSAYQDAWIAIIFSLTGGLILMRLYIFIGDKYPTNSLVQILLLVFGKTIGRIISILYIWYFLHIASMILRNFGEFMATTSYTETPILFIITIFALISAYGLKKGLEVIARTSELILPVVAIIATFLIFALISKYHITNLLPILERGWTSVLRASLGVFTFPFGETIMFLMVFPYLNKKSAKKPAIKSILIGGIFLLILTLRDLFVLGPNMFERLTFPPSVVAELIPKLQIDPLIGVNFLIGGWIKYSICMFAAASGIAQLANLEDYTYFIFPLTYITVSLSIWLYDDIFEMFHWTELSVPYDLIFQLFLPLLIVGVGIFKKKSSQKTGS